MEKQFRQKVSLQVVLAIFQLTFNVNSTMEINDTNLLPTSQSLMQTLTVSRA